MKYRVAIVLQNGTVIAKNFQTREEVDEFILTQDYKNYRIKDRDTGRTLETERGKL